MSILDELSKEDSRLDSEIEHLATQKSVVDYAYWIISDLIKEHKEMRSMLENINSLDSKTTVGDIKHLQNLLNRIVERNTEFT